jgi:hypothetical protein
MTQNQHWENGYTNKINQYIQGNLYQNYNDILYRDRKINSKVHMETEKPSNTQSNC